MTMSTSGALPRYSEKYSDGRYEYRHVVVSKDLIRTIPSNRCMDEHEWRALGIRQGLHWEHYMIHKPEPHVLLFRRPLLSQYTQPIIADSTMKMTDQHAPPVLGLKVPLRQLSVNISSTF
ncbi:unnamed protein product [Didymodactylos carnosus]|uniref:Cyclin-dependent kinases regulatory subunit n=1 Tax=Didymodactylos carnosus TaxID=1234261 RepID=A0A814Q953_9BILA|nr:unnamed protein product [Didymodactylos carnosus]CAF1117085.1 unnamed protein product [Didymodactylos carnosus]CAF3805961.1 unnamed protein product [Didymodactylos carnosus]CAF3880937.1 unnamed protein product [Didymodactylos carnosus]